MRRGWGQAAHITLNRPSLTCTPFEPVHCSSHKRRAPRPRLVQAKDHVDRGCEWIALGVGQPALIGDGAGGRSGRGDPLRSPSRQRANRLGRDKQGDDEQGEEDVASGWGASGS